MIDTKSIISTFIGSAFIITICIAPAVSVAESSRLMLTQAHEHDQEKGNGKSSGGHKGGEGKGDHGKDEKNDKHGAKKSGGMKKDKPDYAHMVISHTDTLKLGNEQLGEIVRLHLKHKQEHEQLKKKLKESMKAFKKESMRPDTSDDQLYKLGKDHTDAFNAMVEHHIKERHAIHAVLSNDQKNQLDIMKMEHEEHDDNHIHH